ncbi:hypothetical protein [Deinococcus hopiensis]|nr:hypothetical protein [Deinococcus hopiensis]
MTLLNEALTHARSRGWQREAARRDARHGHPCAHPHVAPLA